MSQYRHTLARKLLHRIEAEHTMPTTINGIGTQYYGKRNPRVYNAVCESCGNHTKLTDYETGYYFVVIFIPLIPLGKKQILGDCAACRRHRVLPLKEWERMREEAIDEGMAALAANPNDPSKAIELLGTMTVFNRMEDAFDLAGATAQSHADDVDMQLGLGGWYEEQGRTAAGDECFQRAISLQPDYPPCLRVAAIDLIQAGKPSAAAEKLAKFRHPSELFEPALFVMLASCYQEQNQHEEALNEFKLLIDAVPEVGKDKQIRKQVKKSEKAAGRADTILPKKGLFG